MTAYLLFLISDGARMYVLHRFFRLYLEEKEGQRRIRAAAYMIFFAVSGFLHLVFRNPVLNLAVNLSGYFLLSCLYRGSWIRRGGIAATNYILTMVTEAVPFYLLFSFVPRPVLETALVPIPVLEHFMVVLILERYCRRESGRSCTGTEWGCVFLLPAGSIVIMLCSFLFMDNNTAQVIVSLVLFGINLVTFYLLEQTDQYYEERNRNVLLRTQNEAYQNQILIQQESEKRMSALRHDWKNHLYRLRLFAAEQQEEKLQIYLEDMEKALESDGKISATGNRTVDSMINYKLGRALPMGISVNLDIKIPETLEISDFDLTGLLGNLLDNALEALEKTEEKRLRLSIWLEKDLLFLEMENTCLPPVQRKDGSYKSTKDDPSHHGIGLQNIRIIVEKYVGKVSFFSGQGYFRTEAVMLNRKM